MNDMLTSDWLLRSFKLRDSGGVYVTLVGCHMEHVLSSRPRFLFFFSWRVVLPFQDAAVVKVFDWLVIIRQINKFVH